MNHVCPDIKDTDNYRERELPSITYKDKDYSLSEHLNVHYPIRFQDCQCLTVF